MLKYGICIRNFFDKLIESNFLRLLRWGLKPHFLVASVLEYVGQSVSVDMYLILISTGLRIGVGGRPM